MRGYLLTVMLLFFVGLNAQTLNVSNIQVQEDGTVTFSAQVGSKSTQRERYQLSVSSSVDNFQQTVVIESDELSPGRIYDLSFNGNLLVGEYSGQISFKFAVNATVFPVRITDGTDEKLKIGKDYSITWEDFHESGNYKIELLRNGSIYQILDRSFPGTTYNGVLPETITKGDNYSIRVTPVNNEELASEGYSVSVVKPVGLLVKIAPAVLAGGGAAAYFLINTSGDDPTDFPETPGEPPIGN